MVYCVAPPPLSRPGVRAVSPVLLAVMTRTVIALVVLVTLVTLVTAEALVAGEVVVDGVVPGVGGPLGVVVYYLGVGWGVVCDQFTGHHPASAVLTEGLVIVVCCMVWEQWLSSNGAMV